jgi:hypothetical protein
LVRIRKILECQQTLFLTPQAERVSAQSNGRDRCPCSDSSTGSERSAEGAPDWVRLAPAFFFGAGLFPLAAAIKHCVGTRKATLEGGLVAREDSHLKGPLPDLGGRARAHCCQGGRTQFSERSPPQPPGGNDDALGDAALGLIGGRDRGDETGTVSITPLGILVGQDDARGTQTVLQCFHRRRGLAGIGPGPGGAARILGVRASPAVVHRTFMHGRG